MGTVENEFEFLSPRGEDGRRPGEGFAGGAKRHAPPHPPCGSFSILSPRGEDGRRPGEGLPARRRDTPLIRPAGLLPRRSVFNSSPPGERMAEGQVRGCGPVRSSNGPSSAGPLAGAVFDPLPTGERMAEGQVRGCPRGEEARPSSALRAPSPRGEKECLPGEGLPAGRSDTPLIRSLCPPEKAVFNSSPPGERMAEGQVRGCLPLQRERPSSALRPRVFNSSPPGRGWPKAR